MGYIFGLIFLPLFAVMENSVLVEFRIYFSSLFGIAPFYGQPSLVLMAVIAWSWHSDLTEAIFWAFLGGIVLDILNPIVPMGASVIAPVVMIFAVKTIERLFYRVSILALVGFIAIGTILHHLVILGVFTMQAVNVPFIEYFQAYSIPSLAFNLVLIMPMYWFLRRFQKRIPQRQSAWAVSPRG